MKLWIMSDLHQEFDEFAWRPSDPPDHDLLVLAGDIHVPASRAVAYAASLTDRPVILIAGNHEAYGHEIDAALEEAKRTALAHGNVRFCENDVVAIDGTRFVCATLWTDLRLGGPGPFGATVHAVRRGMNDYRRIKILRSDGKRRKRLDPRHTLDRHRTSRAFIAAECARARRDGARVVVVTHHAPIIEGCPREVRGNVLTAAYASDLTQLIGEHRPTLWVHGHTHHCHETFVGGTRVVSNARGYAQNTGRPFDGSFVVEV